MHSFDNLQREARRLIDCHEESGLSLEQVNAFAIAIFEIAQAIASAQKWPMGYECIGLSAECIAAFRTAADMAAEERKVAKQYGAWLVPLHGEVGKPTGEVIPFPGRNDG